MDRIPSTAVKIEDILDARKHGLNAGLAAAKNIFCPTWLASHVYFVEYTLREDISDAVFLADLLTPHSFFPDLVTLHDNPAELWLPKATIVLGTRESLALYIDAALQDIATEIGYAADYPEEIPCLEETQALLKQIDLSQATQIHEIVTDHRAPKPNQQYNFGPTNLVFWHANGSFYFLEIHNES